MLAGDMNFGALADRYIWKAIYLIAVPWKYICGWIGARQYAEIRSCQHAFWISLDQILFLLTSARKFLSAIQLSLYPD
jgi:hypothetical protein